MDNVLTATGTPAHQKGKLLRILGLGFGLAVVVGGTIGVSIFRIPGPVAALLGVPWLIILIWVIGGVYTLLSANYTSELATMLPLEGGPYVYAHKAFGPYAGFVVGWTGWLGDAASMTFMAIAFGEYFVALFASQIFSSPTTVAVAVLILLGLINWLGLRLSSQVQKLVSFLKALFLLIFVAACFIYGHQVHPGGIPLKATAVTPFAIFTAITLAFQLIIAAYGGWNTAVFFAEEDKDPVRNMPRSLHGGTLLVMIVYLLVVCALLYVLPLPQMAASNLAAADAMKLILGPQSGKVITVLALFSIFGILNATILYLPRVLYGLGRDGLFSSKATWVNKGGTPTIGLVMTITIAVLFTQLGSFDTMVAIYTFYAVANNILLIASLFVLRKTQPHIPRPFKTWGYPYAPFLLLLISLALFIGYFISNTVNSLYALTALAASYPLYRFIKKNNHTAA